MFSNSVKEANVSCKHEVFLPVGTNIYYPFLKIMTPIIRGFFSPVFIKTRFQLIHL